MDLSVNNKDVMSPKDKAEELVGKYRLVFVRQKEWISDRDCKRAEKCALIAVDEIIKALEITTGHCTLRKLDAQEVYHDLQYYKQVKSEIEKL